MPNKPLRFNFKCPPHTLVRGVFFMCRKNQLCGCALITFGLGLLIGTWLESGFFSFLIGIGIMALGFWCAGKK